MTDTKQTSFTPVVDAESWVPNGWKLVQVEPAWNVLIEGRDALMDTDDEIDLSTDQIYSCYRAMLAGMPKPPAVQAGRDPAIIQRIRERLKHASPNDRCYEKPMSWAEADELLALYTSLAAALATGKEG